MKPNDGCYNIISRGICESRGGDPSSCVCVYSDWYNQIILIHPSMHYHLIRKVPPLQIYIKKKRINVDSSTTDDSLLGWYVIDVRL